VRIATRTALAALAAAVVSVLVIGFAVRRSFESVLRDRVDRQLEQRADSARVLAAVAVRLADSKLAPTVQPARVLLSDGRVISLGTLPAEPLPPVRGVGWSTARADNQRWRLFTVEAKVAASGGRTLVQLVEPLGNTDAAAAQFRRRFLVFGMLAAVGAAVAGWLFGVFAARPLSRLRRDASRLDPQTPSTWSVAGAYGAVEVDELASALRDGLHRVADETARRDAALSSSRSFAASAAHELRTPLQSALLNLGIASDPRTDDETRRAMVTTSAELVQRMGAALSAVRALADAEVADPSWFEVADLADVVDRAVADEARRFPNAQVSIDVQSSSPINLWCDGAQMAIANVVRNALLHGRPSDGVPPAVRIHVGDAEVIVDDNGPGIENADRERVVQRFERGRSTVPGSGLGLSIASQVAQAHGGDVVIGESPLGGTRVTLRFSAT
jgi:two-component system sensor histidine kinase PrrB